VRFNQVKHFWSTEVINYSTAYIHYCIKSYISVRGYWK